MINYPAQSLPVLLVDDDEIGCEMMALTLREGGVRNVICLSDSRRVLPFLQEQQQERHLRQLEQQREDERGQCRAFDERRGQDHRAADISRRFGLPRDRFDRLAADAADAEPGPDDGEPHPDAGAKQRVVVQRGRDFGGSLEQHEHVVHFVLS